MIQNENYLPSLNFFNTTEIKEAYLNPTKNGMDKSIIDAIKPLRIMFRESNFHDYDQQSQGPENKILKKGYFIGSSGLQETIISLYRPNTKRGDPRIWAANLKNYAAPNSLLALFILEGKLYILNCSNHSIFKEFSSKGNLFKLFTNETNQISKEASEILQKIQDISDRGFIKTKKSGDTGIGYTLETLLNIQANSSKAPDFKGIEIKSLRKRNNKGTLLSMVPDLSLIHI